MVGRARAEGVLGRQGDDGRGEEAAGQPRLSTRYRQSYKIVSEKIVPQSFKCFLKQISCSDNRKLGLFSPGH